MAIAASFTLFAWLPTAPARAQPVQTLRYDLPGAELHIFNLEILQDFFFPVEPAEIVKTRFHLVFNTQSSAGSFPAQDIALELQPPVPSPTAPGELLTEVFTGGADFGWSGSTGTFTFDGETDALDGVAVPAPKGAFALLYAIRTFNARRLTDPGDTTPLGGQFIDSWIDVDYVLIPEPSGAVVLGACGAALLGRRCRGSHAAAVKRAPHETAGEGNL